MNYLEFKNWKNSHITEMQDLTYARPDDIFIFTRFTIHRPFELESKQVLYAESVEEWIGYIRHIFLYDILNDIADDLEFDFKTPYGERQKDAISILSYWYKLGKFSTESNKYQNLNKFCKDFNTEFNFKENAEYEIQILNGADELREFLISKYSKCKNFDRKRLSNICSKELFAGRLLKDFLDMLFQ